MPAGRGSEWGHRCRRCDGDSGDECQARSAKIALLAGGKEEAIQVQSLAYPCVCVCARARARAGGGLARTVLVLSGFGFGIELVGGAWWVVAAVLIFLVPT